RSTRKECEFRPPNPTGLTARRGGSRAQSTLFYGPVLIRVEGNFHSQIYGCGLAVKYRSLVLSLRHCLHRRGYQQRMAADRFELNNITVFIDNRFDYHDSADVGLPGQCWINGGGSREQAWRFHVSDDSNRLSGSFRDRHPC